MGQIMNFDQLYPGRFLKAGHLDQPRTLRIRAIEHEELHGEKGPQLKVIVHFEEEKLSLVACKTNGLCLKHMFGNHVPNWIGKRVTLFASEWNGEPCIRVWGSPELERDEECQVQLPRRKPFTMKLRAVKDGAPAPKKAGPPPHVAALAQKLREAPDALAIAHITDEITATQDLTAYDREWLGKQLVKRQRELQEASSAK